MTHERAANHIDHGRVSCGVWRRGAVVVGSINKGIDLYRAIDELQLLEIDQSIEPITIRLGVFHSQAAVHQVHVVICNWADVVARVEACLSVEMVLTSRALHAVVARVPKQRSIFLVAS